METIYLDSETKGVQAVEKQVAYAIASARVREISVCKIILPQDSPFLVSLLRYTKKYLKQMKDRGRISVYLQGTQFGEESIATGYLVDKVPELAKDMHYGKKDPSIFIIALG